MPDQDADLAALGLSRDSLAEQVAVVAGANAALGRQAARALVNLGARVVFASASPEPGAATEALLRRAGGQAVWVPADAASPTDIAALMRSCEAEFGPVSLALHSSSSPPPVPLADLPAEQWETGVERNMRGAFLLARFCLPSMFARRQGTFVTVVPPDTGQAASSTLTQALTTFTHALAAEAGPGGVRVTGLLADARSPASPRGNRQAAIAVAWLLARAAGEFAGQVVPVERVLEHARGSRSATLPKAGPRSGSRAAEVMRALELAERLRSTLLETEAEFERLPMAVRPLARGGFVSRVGCASDAALKAVGALGDQLRRIQASHSGQDTEFSFDFARLSGLLERLQAYYETWPSESARLDDDRARQPFLRQVSADRAHLVRSLSEVIAHIHG